MAYNKVRIQLRNDSELNWLSAADQVLLSGEVAIVRLQNGLTKVKVGDGTSKFSELHYLDEDELDTHHLSAIHISQGFNAQSSPTGIAGGAYVNANANFSQVFGYGASTKASDDFSFVWNGKTDVVPGVLGGTDYESHGKGTFNINALSGLSGIYIGEQNLASHIDDRAKATFVKDTISTDVPKVIINKVLPEEYDDLSARGLLREDQLYVIESDILDAKGNWVKNVKTPTLSSDAANKEYVDSHAGGNAKAVVEIQMIRPREEHDLNITLSVCTDPEMSQLVTDGAIESESNVAYFKGLLVSQGTATWAQYTSPGFGREYSNQPIAFDLPQCLEDKGIETKDITKLYVKYVWRWTDDELVEHKSDEYAIVLPACTEVGANSNDSASKTEVETLKQQVNPVAYGASYDEYGMLRCYTTKMNELGNVVDQQDIVLDSYDQSKSYYMKFTTAETAQIRFNIDVGNGPQYDGNMNINQSFSFPEGTYIAEVKFDSMTVNNCSYSGGGGGSSAAVWGKITGNIASQTDLQYKFNDYYQKSETSSAIEIQHALENIPVPSTTAIRRWYNS